MTKAQEDRFRELLDKRCFQTATGRENKEFDRLQRIRRKEHYAEMDITNPGWRKRELAHRRKVNRLIRKMKTLKKVAEKA